MPSELAELKSYVKKEYSRSKIDFSYGDTHIDNIDDSRDVEIIRTKFWDLPVNSLDGWRPFSAYIDYRVFLGPDLLSSGRGLSLHKDLMGGIHGSRGSGKSEFLSFLLAKKMRSGKPVWTNYPISFFVVEPDGSLTYYESMPLDFNKFYAFSPLVRNGAVGVTELQYYVEARTSGKAQNRVATYQIMQIRKTALSFLYDVQDRSWVDKRFGWSNDFDIECADIAKLSYDRTSARGYPATVYDEYGHLREGAFVSITIEDTSGVLTGTKYAKNNIDYGPYQFDAYNIWNIYPTHFIIDAYEAMNSYKTAIKDEKTELKDIMANSLEKAINYFLNEGVVEVKAPDMWEKVQEIARQPLKPQTCGVIMKEWGIPKRQIGSNKIWAYDLGVLLKD